MKTVRDLLRDADPVAHEPHRLEQERARLRQAIVAAASVVTAPRTAWFRAPNVLLVAAILMAVGLLVVGPQIWSQGSAILRAAAIQFEVRLAEDRPATGLREARVGESDRVVYLHPDPIVTNADIAHSRVVGDERSGFGVSVEFNAAGAEKMRRATADHIGRPLAILIDGEVIMAPTLRSAISTSALLTGDYTRAEAERIVNGIRVR